ncbi:MAG: DEAD/DEAH box helicase, partial [Candidatus Margulisiibacteriota bacterium]
YWLLKEVITTTGIKTLERDSDKELNFNDKQEFYSFDALHVFRRADLKPGEIRISEIPSNRTIENNRSSSSVFSANDYRPRGTSLVILVKRYWAEADGINRQIVEINDHGRDTLFWLMDEVVLPDNKGKLVRNKDFNVVRTDKGGYQLQPLHKKYQEIESIRAALEQRKKKDWGTDYLSLSVGPNPDHALLEACRRFPVQLLSEDTMIDKEYAREAFINSIKLPGQEGYSWQLDPSETLKLANTSQKILLSMLTDVEQQLAVLANKTDEYSKKEREKLDSRKKRLIKQTDTIKHLKASPVILELFGRQKPKAITRAQLPHNIVIKNRELDEFQRLAVQTALQSDTRVALVQGGAGSGKTTTVVAIVEQLAAANKKVLIVSRTNQAVDNIILKLLQRKNNVQRIFSKYRKDAINEGLHNRQAWMPGDIPEGKNGLIVGVTTDSLYGAPASADNTYDVVIIDEAGTLNQTETLLCAAKAKEKLLLAGDHKQLEPFYNDKEHGNRTNEEKLVLKESGMAWLWDKGFARVFLARNYRNHPLVAILLSRLIYDGQMVPKMWRMIEQDTMHFADVPMPKGSRGNEITLARTKDSLRIVSEGVALNDSEKISRYLANRPNEKLNNDEPKEGILINLREAEQVIAEVQRALNSGYGLEQIRIISGYNGQIQLLQSMFRELQQNGFGQGKYTPAQIARFIEEQIVTTDKMQGSEGELVILTTVRSNPDPSKVGHMNKLNRLNVSLSRGMERLILVGDKTCLENAKHTDEDKIFSELMREMKRLQGEFAYIRTQQEKQGLFSIREGIQMINNSLRQPKPGHRSYELNRSVLAEIEKLLSASKNSLDGKNIKNSEYDLLEDLHERALKGYGDYPIDENSFDIAIDLAIKYPEILAYDEDSCAISLLWLTDKQGQPARIILSTSAEEEEAA